LKNPGKRTWLKSSLFRKQLLTFGLGMLPILFLGLYFFNSGVKALRAEITSSLNAQVVSFMYTFDKEFLGIKQNLYNSYEDFDLNRLAYFSNFLTGYERVDAMRNLQARLFAVQNSSRYIENVSVYFRDIQKVVGSNGKIDDVPAGEYEQLAILSKQQDQLVKVVESRLMMVDSSPYGRRKDEVLPAFIFVVNLSSAELMNALEYVNTYEEGWVYLYNSDQSFKLYVSKGLDAADQPLLSNSAVPDQSAGMTTTIAGASFLSFSSTSEIADLKISKFVREQEIIKPMNNFMVLFWIFFTMILVILVLYSYLSYRSFYRPISDMMYAFRELQNGVFTVRLKTDSKDEFAYIYDSFNKTAEDLKEMIDNVYEKELLLQRAKLKQLQAQINPHFLYNSFFILRGRIEAEDTEGAASFCEKLGRYFEYITRVDRDEVCLPEEADHAKIYTDIQATRFGSRLKVVFDETPAQFADLVVPRLIMQPILENMFKYSFDSHIGESLISVRYFPLGDLLKVYFDDNGNGMQSEPIAELNRRLALQVAEGEVSGLLNIHKRIQLKFGAASGLILQASELGGLCVVMTIDRNGGKHSV
jgi:two-component system, sensor histidine kinase YesM